jgi:hypothetical protein
MAEQNAEYASDDQLLCGFFEAWPEAGPGMVQSDVHHAGEGPLYFFWPLPDGNAIRVPVCPKHCEWLEAHAQPVGGTPNAGSRSPGSSPGRVGAAREGSLEESEGVGFPQAHPSPTNADYMWDWINDDQLPHGGTYVVKGPEGHVVVVVGPLKYDYEQAVALAQAMNKTAQIDSSESEDG